MHAYIGKFAKYKYEIGDRVRFEFSPRLAVRNCRATLVIIFAGLLLNSLMLWLYYLERANGGALFGNDVLLLVAGAWVALVLMLIIMIRLLTVTKNAKWIVWIHPKTLDLSILFCGTRFHYKRDEWICCTAAIQGNPIGGVTNAHQLIVAVVHKKTVVPLCASSFDEYKSVVAHLGKLGKSPEATLKFTHKVSATGLVNLSSWQ